MPHTNVPAPADVHRAYREELDPTQKSVLWSWLAFTTTFGVLRAITYSIKDGKGPFHNFSTKGGIHLHHYLWGIAMVSSVGSLAVRGDHAAVEHPIIAITYGAGMALIVDEFALLLDLQDVYWAKQGRWSVDLGVGIIALTGSALAAAPIAQRLRRDRKKAGSTES
jgi:hypothetical protein